MRERFRPTLVQAALLLGLSVAVAGAMALWHPRAPSWFLVEEPDPWAVTPEQVRAFTDEVVWIDARPQKLYDKGHLEGAILLDEDQWGDLMFQHQDALMAAVGKPVVIYCDGKRCKRSQSVAQKLRELVGLDPVYVLKGDWREFAGESSR